MIAIARYLLIATAIALFPLYALWIFAGWIADRRERRRHFRNEGAR